MTELCTTLVGISTAFSLGIRPYMRIWSGPQTTLLYKNMCLDIRENALCLPNIGLTSLHDQMALVELLENSNSICKE